MSEKVAPLPEAWALPPAWARALRKARGEPEDVDQIREAHALAAAYHAERTARLWAHCRTMTERRQESLRTVPAWVMEQGQ